MEMKENEDLTLEQMRAQAAILKEKLAKEKLVNEDMVKKAIMKDYSLIRRHVVIEVAAAVSVIVWAFTYLPFILHTSIFFNIFTVLMMLVCMGTTIYLLGRIRSTDAYTMDMASSARRMKKLKREYDIFWKLSFIPLLVWIAWFGIEISRSVGEALLLWCMLGGVTVGAIIGIIVAFRMRSNLMNAFNDVIEHTKEE